MQDRDALPFIRSDDDDHWDDRLSCENPDCEDPLCPHKMNRDAMRIALGTVVEALETLASVQVLSQEYWGGCADPKCTFEGQMQEEFSLAGKSLSVAFVHLLDGIEMWKGLPSDWSEPEHRAAIRAIQMLRHLNQEAIRQVLARAAGSPDPRRPDLTPRSN